MAREPEPLVVMAEMVANVMKVYVGPGDVIAAGDTVVLLESMKMEIPVLAEAGGTVTEVKVGEGTSCRKGTRSSYSPLDH